MAKLILKNKYKLLIRHVPLDMYREVVSALIAFGVGSKFLSEPHTPFNKEEKKDRYDIYEDLE